MNENWSLATVSCHVVKIEPSLGDLGWTYTTRGEEGDCKGRVQHTECVDHATHLTLAVLHSVCSRVHEAYKLGAGEAESPVVNGCHSSSLFFFLSRSPFYMIRVNVVVVLSR